MGSLGVATERWAICENPRSEGGTGIDVGAHDYIDILSIVGLVASTLGAVVLAQRLSQHQKLEDKVNQHDSRILAIETALEWIRKLFKQE